MSEMYKLIYKPPNEKDILQHAKNLKQPFAVYQGILNDSCVINLRSPSRKRKFWAMPRKKPLIKARYRSYFILKRFSEGLSRPFVS